MKKLLSCALAAALILGIPSLAMAKGKGKDKLSFGGKVTAVTATTITITHGKNAKEKTETITVPTGTSITEKDGSAAPALADLIGKKVKVKESAPGTAAEIVVKAKKGKKKKNA